MSNDFFGLSWRPSDQDSPQSASELEFAGKSPDEILVTSIIEKNVAGVQHALALGANHKMLVGKEKMGAFCMRHFNKDVVELLDKQGVSFKDIANISLGIAGSDSVDALEWFVNSPRMKKMLLDPNDSSRYVIMSNLLDCGAVECVLWLKDVHPELVSKTFNQAFSNSSAGFLFSALKKGNADAFDFTLSARLHKPPTQILADFFSFNAHDFTLADCVFLQSTLEQKPHVAQVWDEMWRRQNDPKSNSPLLSGDHILASKFNCYQISKKCLATDRTQSSYYTYQYDPKNFLEMLVCHSSKLICSLTGAVKEQMDDALFDGPNSPKLLFGYMQRASRDTIKSFFDAYPKAHTWRDDTGSNLFHYVMVRSTDHSFAAPKVLYETLFSIDPDLCFETNHGKVHSFAHIPPELQSALQAKMMKKELKKSNLHHGHQEANVARKRKM